MSGEVLVQAAQGGDGVTCPWRCSRDVAQRFSGHGGDGLVVEFDGRT